jgi:hypothetical protein
MAIVALLSISLVSDVQERDYMTEAQENYTACTNVAVIRNELQTSTVSELRAPTVWEREGPSQIVLTSCTG